MAVFSAPLGNAPPKPEQRLKKIEQLAPFFQWPVAGHNGGFVS